jgi:transposase
MLSFFAGLSPCLIGMEACTTSHQWVQKLIKLGYAVKLMPPAYVKAYVKRRKTDAADAEAICEAVTRPSMRCVPIKSAEQQSVLTLHRMRALLIRQRTMLINALRGHLAEYGIIVAQGISRIRELIKLMTNESADAVLPPLPAPLWRRSWANSSICRRGAELLRQSCWLGTGRARRAAGSKQSRASASSPLRLVPPP